MLEDCSDYCHIFEILALFFFKVYTSDSNTQPNLDRCRKGLAIPNQHTDCFCISVFTNESCLCTSKCGVVCTLKNKKQMSEKSVLRFDEIFVPEERLRVEERFTTGYEHKTSSESFQLPIERMLCSKMKISYTPQDKLKRLYR